MRPQDVALVTTTRYGDTWDLRYVLACQTTAFASYAGYRVIGVDGSPNLTVALGLRRWGAIVIPEEGEERGMGPSRRQAFSYAGTSLAYLKSPFANLEAPLYYVWLELEKDDFVRCIPQLIEPLACGEADIVIPKRASLVTWPEFQQQSEARANAAYRDATGWDYDPMGGPVAFTHDMLQFFMTCRPEYYGVSPYAAGYIQHFAPMEAHAAGHRIMSVTVDYRYPEAQRRKEETTLSEDMRKKRLTQENELSAGYHICANALGIGAYRRS